MDKRLKPKLLLVMLLAVCITGLVYGGVVAHYTFDDADNIGADAAGDHEGTPAGDAAFSDDAVVGAGSLALDGDADFVDLDGQNFFSELDDDGDGFSVTAWVKYATGMGLARIISTDKSEVIGWRGDGWGVGLNGNLGQLWFTTYGLQDYVLADQGPVLPAEQWLNVAFVYKTDGSADYYVDGVLQGTILGNFNMINSLSNFIIGGLALPTALQWYDGLIDDLRIYDNELDADAIMTVVDAPNLASKILPATSVNVPVDTTLEWAAPSAIESTGYDVYFGTDPNVPDNPKVSVGPDVTTLDPGLLENGATYYWRVDTFEPNDPAPLLHVGETWSFVTIPDVPVVEADPQDLTVAAGTDATFTVAGLNQTGYEWFRSGDNANDTPDDDVSKGPGDGEGNLTIQDVQLEDEGYYYCTLSNESGSVKSVPAKLMTQRLIAYWAFDGNLSDQTGAHDGIAFGEDPNFAPGIIGDGQAVQLTGTAQAVEIPYDEELNTASFTLSVWGNVEVLTGVHQALVSLRNQPPTQGYIVYAPPSNNWQFWTGTGGTGWPGIGGSAVVAGEWTHIAISFDALMEVTDGVYSGTKRLFVNGVQVGEVEGVTYGVNNQQSLLIGGGENESVNRNFFFGGLIDDVQLWNYARDPIDISMIYTNQTGESVCVDSVGLQYDYNNNCVVDLEDFATFAATWLHCRIVPHCF